MNKINWILSFLLWGQVLLLQAQTLEEQIAIPLSQPGQAGSLKVNIIHGNLKVQGYEGKEVVIRVKGKGNQMEKPEKEKEGLRRISSGGLGLEVREENNSVWVEVSPMGKLEGLEIMVPYNFSLNLETVSAKAVEVIEVRGEMEVNSVNGDIILDDVQGSAVVNTVNGDIRVIFAKVTPGVPMAFTNLNGKIEVNLPPRTAFSIKAKTEHGGVFTDFDIDLKKSGDQMQTSRQQGVYKVSLENWTIGNINGGGPEYLLKSLNGDILIKKK